MSNRFSFTDSFTRFRGIPVDKDEYVYGFYIFEDGKHYIVTSIKEPNPVEVRSIEQYVNETDMVGNPIFVNDVCDMNTPYSLQFDDPSKHVKVTSLTPSSGYDEEMWNDGCHKWRSLECTEILQVLANSHEFPDLIRLNRDYENMSEEQMLDLRSKNN